jgi:hypothetical protein
MAAMIGARWNGCQPRLVRSKNFAANCAVGAAVSRELIAARLCHVREGGPIRIVALERLPAAN